MLYKCANPACLNLFRSLYDGKLFKVEDDGPRLDNSRLNEKLIARLVLPPRKNRQRSRAQHYWLCGHCSPIVTLTFEPGRGMIAVPIRARPLAA
ncbi:MAG: hypothetical protein ABJA69_11300 [Acidobacteriaceae bacterium]